MGKPTRRPIEGFLIPERMSPSISRLRIKQRSA